LTLARNDADAAFARKWKDAGFDLAVEEVVGDLHEVERMLAHDTLDVGVTATFRGRNTDITNLAGRANASCCSLIPFSGSGAMDPVKPRTSSCSPPPPRT
jgi:hypothetical protein